MTVVSRRRAGHVAAAARLAVLGAERAPMRKSASVLMPSRRAA
jgi:hypothetical protein